MLLSARILAAAGMATSPLAPVEADGACDAGTVPVRCRPGRGDPIGLVCADASVSMMAMTSPATTVAPSFLMSCTITPAFGAGSSRTTLSVSMSIRFSSRETGSPTFLCHDSRVASATDSDNWGTLTSICAI
jgi:hypothetical protein